jgi:ferritin-like metal-binding protein YciE
MPWPLWESQVERLEQVFDFLGKPARGKTCPAIDGILEEGSESSNIKAPRPLTPV